MRLVFGSDANLLQRHSRRGWKDGTLRQSRGRSIPDVKRVLCRPDIFLANTLGREVESAFHVQGTD